MSIINDALKKIEKQAKKEPQGPQFDAAGLKESKVPEKKTFNVLASKKFLVLVCIFVLAISFILILNPPSKKTPVRFVEIGSPGNNNASGAAQNSSSQEKGLSFPFRNVLEPVKSRSGFELSGIMLSADGPVAIINNEIVKQGDVIDGASVSSIKENSVNLSYQGQELVLSVK